MTRYKITAPVEGANCTVAGVLFTASVAETDNEGAVAYFRRHGYQVETLTDPSEDPDPPAPSAVESEPESSKPRPVKATKPAPAKGA